MAAGAAICRVRLYIDFAIGAPLTVAVGKPSFATGDLTHTVRARDVSLRLGATRQAVSAVGTIGLRVGACAPATEPVSWAIAGLRAGGDTGTRCGVAGSANPAVRIRGTTHTFVSC